MKTYALILIVITVLFGGSYLVDHRLVQLSRAIKSNTVNSKSATSNTTKPTFNKAQYSISDPSSIWVVVNKLRPLNPKTFVPANLVVPSIALRANITGDEKYVRVDTATALKTMSDAAAAAKITINLQSGYRSYGFQASLYNSYVASQGQTASDRSSARAGYSEHQTGLAADLGGVTQPGCNIDPCFANTLEGRWLAANAYLYGFVIRYPTAGESVTGYEYEPWHIRYVGTALALEMHNTGIVTLEQFFDLPAAPTYQ